MSDVDAAFEEWRNKNPGGSFSQFYAEIVIKHVESGTPHHTLGKKLRKGADWATTGTKQFQLWRDAAQITERSKVVDYGCGSLRLGSHFIKFLEPESYFGLDIVPDFYEIGRQLMGPELIKEKRPRFGVISDSLALTAAINTEADLVLASGVSIHIHPDEVGEFFRNLTSLAGKRGTRLIFDATLADDCVHYSDRSWARPLEYYVKGLPEFEFVRTLKTAPRVRAGYELTGATLLFRRL
jgi:SAM-dependent methyltransferase